MEKHDEGAKEEKSNTVTEKDLEPAKKDVDASDAAKNAPADHEATVAKTSTTSNTTASSGSHGDSSRHKKNSSSPTDVSDRDGGGWLPPLKKFFTVDNWMWKKAAGIYVYIRECGCLMHCMSIIHFHSCRASGLWQYVTGREEEAL